ncbi:L-threonylcarbamoyladenylate synthase [Candidatus Planktophila vernalis]|uniref:Threonylcarbamoyl-AMP synthase n=1 Tax=Candidatus Planktophila vernalis TaxID=1884907 RepID=A0A249KUM1_9ACTN|nr:L-threonylcarbamoyladenylate synthase [Candidatus Planktophila vernalis]
MLDAAAHLKAGDLVAFPTETVYGLGADASNSKAVSRIYSVKGRPNDHPLIVHIASMDRMGEWASDVPEYAIALARSFWPGPMTLVVHRSRLAADFVTGGQDTVGVRVPNHPVALGLLEAFARIGGSGVAAPSANRFGKVSPTTPKAVLDELSDYLADDDLILDGGACDVGVESTIIDCTGDLPRILRPGAVTVAMIAGATGLDTIEEDMDKSDIRVSGSLDSHYAPAATVVLDQSPLAGQGFIAMSDVATPDGVVRLAAPKSDDEFGRVLYAALRAADEQGLQTVVVNQPPGEGIATAIRDRLKRASNYK